MEEKGNLGQWRMRNAEDASCLQLAREGERQIRENNFQKGIDYLERAISVGTGDLTTLSAIYSQLGNAFFSIRSYSKALEYHNNDLLLARVMMDKVGEAKACGNLGNTWKALGGFNDAIMFIERQLDLARQLNDRMLEARALFHLGTSYQMRGKQLGKRLKSTNVDLSNHNLSMSSMLPFTEDLEKSVVYFKENLRLSEELNDELACGRIYGHLGNTYYLLRDYVTAIYYHHKRLETARQFGDKNAMRRAYTNLANAHVFLPNMEKAIEFYRLALSLAYELHDKLAEAQSCFSLANAAAIVHDYHTAAEYHLRHLRLARDCMDRAGEARAYASLAVDYKNVGDLPKAAYFYLRNRHLAKEMSDVSMIESANEGLRETIREGGAQMIKDGEVCLDSCSDPDAQNLRLSASLASIYEDRREPTATTTSDCGLSRMSAYHSDGELHHKEKTQKHSWTGSALSQDEFFDLLSRMQSKRLDEQRCDPTILSDVTNRKGPRQTDTLSVSPGVRERRGSIFGRLAGSIHDSALISSLRETPQTLHNIASNSSILSRIASLKSLRKPSVPDRNKIRITYNPDPCTLASNRLCGSAVNLHSRGHLTPELFNNRLGRSAVNLSCADSDCASTSSTSEPPKKPKRGVAHRSTSPASQSYDFPMRSDTPTCGSVSSVSTAKEHSIRQPQQSMWRKNSTVPSKDGPEAIIDMIINAQARRMDEQRANLILPGLHDRVEILQKLSSEQRNNSTLESPEVDDHLYEMVLRSQSERLNEQRSELGGRQTNSQEPASPQGLTGAVTIPEDDITALVLRMQAGRIDEQRAHLHPNATN